MVTEIWVSIGSGSGLLPDGIKPLPKQMFLIGAVLCIHWTKKFTASDLGAKLCKECKNILIKLLTHLPEANELMYFSPSFVKSHVSLVWMVHMTLRWDLHASRLLYITVFNSSFLLENGSKIADDNCKVQSLQCDLENFFNWNQFIGVWLMRNHHWFR